MTGEEIFALAQQQQDERADRMPTERDAIQALFNAYQRLKELGWNDAIYAPKDGTEFDSVFAGSTGIGCTFYLGDWPSGGFFTAEGGDLWPGDPILYRAKTEPAA